MTFNYEHVHQPLVPWQMFLRRLARHGGIALIIVAMSIAIGMTGYHVWGRQSWIDSFLNACMLLGGQGPIGVLTTNGGKIFAAFFALYAGLVFIAVSGVLLAPIMHRVLHMIHLEEKKR